MPNTFQLQFCPDERIAAYAKRQQITQIQAVRQLLGQGIYPERFKRNIGALSLKAQLKLLDLPIFIAGCGGLGGEITAHLAQLGAGNLYLCDFDVFEESNLNRQRFCSTPNLGKPKTEITANALAEKTPWGSFTAVTHKITPNHPPEELANSALLVDCLDSVQGKKMLEEMARNIGIAWLSGAVLEQEGFACLQNRPTGMLAQLYNPQTSESGAGAVLSHVVAGVASLMCALLTKWLENPAFSSSLLHIDFSIPEMEQFIVE